jgi:DNA replication protein DnaC
LQISTDQLPSIARKLRLSGMLDTLDLRLREAQEASWSHTELLVRVLADEIERRDAKALQERLRRADFEHQRTVEAFDFTFNPGVPRALILELATCGFMGRQEVIFLLGPTGTGKSHLAQAIGHRACRLGHDVRFLAARDLFADLRAGHGDGSWARRLKRYTDVDLLIVDDLGLQPMRAEEAADFYEIVRHRYERRSLILTSNRAKAEWDGLFPDPLLGAATMDRLLHHSHVIDIDGDTWRNPRNGKSTRQRSPVP